MQSPSLSSPPVNASRIHADVLIVLTSLRAEGTPRMALDLGRLWQTRGINVAFMVLLPQPDELREEFEALGAPIYQYLINQSGYGRYPRLVWDTFRLCRRLRPRAVLSMPSGIHAFIALGAKLGRAERVVVHQGNYPWYWHTAPFRKYRLEYQLGRLLTDTVVSCSHYVDQGVHEHLGLRPSETTVIYNGISMERFLPPVQVRAAKLASPVPTMAMVGRLGPPKDFPTLLEAAGLLRDRGRRFELWIVGDGEARGRLEEQARMLGIASVVKFLGVRTDVASLLAMIDLFIYAVKPEEGFGIALVEAMVAGVPVVASDVGACREVLDEGALGGLAPPGDPKAMADAIEAVLSDVGAARERAEASRARAEAHFSAPEMARHYAEVLGLDWKEDSAIG